MYYTSLGPESFSDGQNKFSLNILSYYCQLPTTNSFIYTGFINASNHSKLKFPKIVKANFVDTWDIVTQFPNLVEANTLFYYYYHGIHGIPNIGNLKSVNSFSFSLPNLDYSEYDPFIKRFVKVIDRNTLNINGKTLKVTSEWKIGLITSSNYKQKGF